MMVSSLFDKKCRWLDTARYNMDDEWRTHIEKAIERFYEMSITMVEEMEDSDGSKINHISTELIKDYIDELKKELLGEAKS